MRAPFQAGDFPFPVKYGYACVGRIAAGPDAGALLPGQTVFVLHPHQTLFDIPADAAHIVPDHIPSKRAVLSANMETALNALWDGGLAPGDHIAVVGGGVIGALTAWLASRTPGTRVTLIDKNPEKARIARKLGLAFAEPENTRGDNDLVIHASASEAGLETAIGLCGMEATLVEMSWYGERRVTIGLGGAFHARRLRLISSQVGQIPPARRPRWDHARRLATAIRLLDDPCLDALLEEPVAFADLPHCLPRVLAPDAATLCQVVRYPAAAPVACDIS
ncbi:FAD-dependent oxidoreductase [Breoghania sp. L-A4]|nr:FAD-dependent oxidoreductase [Breoghania sp. L-A4]